MRAAGLVGRALAYARKFGIRATAKEGFLYVRRRLRTSAPPSSVHVEISSCCNLRCEYCVLDESALGTRIMSMSTFESVLASLSRASRIGLSGLAEPLMNKRAMDMLGEARRVAPHSHISMCTNAMLLNEEVADQLIEHQLDELVFSLDGIDPAQVDSVRIGGSLNAVVENISRLDSLKHERGSAKPVLSATVVLQQSNLAELDGIVRLAKRLGCDTVSVNGLEPYSPALSSQAAWIEAPDVAKVRESFAAAESQAHALGIDLLLPAMRPQKAHCPQNFRPIVLADGSVVPCSVLAYRRRAVVRVTPALEIEQCDCRTDAVVFGNVNDSGLDSVWMDEKYRSFRRRVARETFPSACANCLLKHGVVCPAPAMTAAESLKTIEAS